MSGELEPGYAHDHEAIFGIAEGAEVECIIEKLRKYSENSGLPIAISVFQLEIRQLTTQFHSAWREHFHFGIAGRPENKGEMGSNESRKIGKIRSEKSAILPWGAEYGTS